MKADKSNVTKHYLLATDFDQTLSFNDSGIILSELLGASGFAKISNCNSARSSSTC